MEQQRRETNVLDVADHVSSLVVAASVDGCRHGRSYDQAQAVPPTTRTLQFYSSKIPNYFKFIFEKNEKLSSVLSHHDTININTALRCS